MCGGVLCGSGKRRRLRSNVRKAWPCACGARGLLCAWHTSPQGIMMMRGGMRRALCRTVPNNVMSPRASPTPHSVLGSGLAGECGVWRSGKGVILPGAGASRDWCQQAAERAADYAARTVHVLPPLRRAYGSQQGATGKAGARPASVWGLRDAQGCNAAAETAAASQAKSTQCAIRCEEPRAERRAAGPSRAAGRA